MHGLQGGDDQTARLAVQAAAGALLSLTGGACDDIVMCALPRDWEHPQGSQHADVLQVTPALIKLGACMLLAVMTHWRLLRQCCSLSLTGGGRLTCQSHGGECCCRRWRCQCWCCGRRRVLMPLPASAPSSSATPSCLTAALRLPQPLSGKVRLPEVWYACDTIQL